MTFLTAEDKLERTQAVVHAQQEKLERRSAALEEVWKLLDPLVRRGEVPNAVVEAWAIAKEWR